MWLFRVSMCPVYFCKSFFPILLLYDWPCTQFTQEFPWIFILYLSNSVSTTPTGPRNNILQRNRNRRMVLWKGNLLTREWGLSGRDSPGQKQRELVLFGLIEQDQELAPGLQKQSREGAERDSWSYLGTDSWSCLGTGPYWNVSVKHSKVNFI